MASIIVHGASFEISDEMSFTELMEEVSHSVTFTVPLVDGDTLIVSRAAAPAIKASSEEMKEWRERRLN